PSRFLCSAKYLPASVSSFGLAFESTWQYTHAFFVCFMYSALPYEAVEQTRKPPSKITAGNVIFKWDIVPPIRKTAIPAPTPNFRISDTLIWKEPRIG